MPDILTCEMRRDEEEGGPEKSEGDSQGSFSLNLRDDACGHGGVFHLCRMKHMDGIVTRREGGVMSPLIIIHITRTETSHEISRTYRGINAGLPDIPDY